MSLRRILSLFVLLAMVLAPAPMVAGSPAMAADRQEAMATGHDSPADAGHPCAGDQAPSGSPAQDCCVMGCAAIPAIGGSLAPVSPQQSLRQPLSPGWDPHGLAPEADPPPPRHA